MEKNCSIIEDILPLYVENMVSTDTRAFVEEHLASCDECRTKLGQLQSPPAPVPMDAMPLKKIKEKLMFKRIQIILFTAALVSAIAVSVFAIMTSPQFFPYSSSLVQVTENQDGILTITFDSSVTGYNYITGRDEETGAETYHISSWNTVWDKYFASRGSQNMIITPASLTDTKIYYVQNNGSEDILIYGQNAEDNTVSTTLPRLYLTQYFILAVFLLIILAMARFLFRKQDIVKLWLNRMIPIPIAYILSHIYTKGFSFKSYSAQRDLSIIILVMICLYCAMLTGESLFRIKKEKN